MVHVRFGCPFMPVYPGALIRFAVHLAVRATVSEVTEILGVVCKKYDEESALYRPFIEQLSSRSFTKPTDRLPEEQFLTRDSHP